MTEHNNAKNGGRFVKKLLFPAAAAAASGANDTFRTNQYQYTNNNESSTSNHNDDELMTATTTTTSPRRSPVSKSSYNKIHNSSHADGRVQQEHSSTRDEEPHASSNNATCTSRKVSPPNTAIGPPRFFSSTHPIGSSADNNNSNNNNNNTKNNSSSDNRASSTIRNSRVLSHWQTQKKNSPKEISSSSSLQTPARAPPSPPALDRQLVTPSTVLTTTTTTKTTQATNNRETKETAEIEKSSSSVPDDGTATHSRNSNAENSLQQEDNAHHGDDELPSDEEQGDEPSTVSSGTTKPQGTRPMKDDGDDSLQFLKQFKAKHNNDKEESSSPCSNEYDNDAETEVHDNTTSYHKFRKEHLEQTVRGRLETTPEMDHTTAQDEHEDTEKSSPLTTSAKNHEDEYIQREEEVSSSPHDTTAMEYPSYYDNPYHNPLVASALKPNDLFRKNSSANDNDNDNANEESYYSDVDSNASEMGTVINAPNLYASRFAEVEAMERAATQGSRNNDDSSKDIDDDHHDDHDNDFQLTGNDILEEEDDPVIANYKAFKAHDDDDDDDDERVSADRTPVDEDSILAMDPFQTPSTGAAGRPQAGNANDDKREMAAVTTDPKRPSQEEQPVTSTTKANQESEIESETAICDQESFIPEQPRNQLAETPQQEALNDGNNVGSLLPESGGNENEDDAAMSDIDSEIDQLVRRSASESSGGGGIVKRCSSNNSADVFRVPSTGSDISSRKQAPQHHQRNHSIPKLGSGRIRPNRIPRRDGEGNDSGGELRVANLLQQQREQDLEVKKVEAKEEKEEELQEQHNRHNNSFKDENYAEFSNLFTGEVPCQGDVPAANPGSNLANTIRRIGSKLTKRSPPSPKEASTANPFFFDIDNEVDGEEDNVDNIDDQLRIEHDFQYGNSLSAPTTPRQQRNENRDQQQQHFHSNHYYNLSKIQEAFQPQSPGKDSAASSQLDGSNAPASFLLRSPGSSARLMADFRRESSGSNSSPENDKDSQRFAFLKQRIPSILQSASSTSLGNGPTPRATGGARGHRYRGSLHVNASNETSSPAKKANPLRYARGCLSFDTTMDHQYEYDYERESAMFRAANNDNERTELRPSTSFDIRQHQHSSPSKIPRAFRQRMQGLKDPDESGQTQALYGSSRSWDITSGKASSLWSAVAVADNDTNCNVEEQPPAVHLDASAFRTAPYVRQRSQLRHPHPLGFNNHNGRKVVSGERQQRLQIMSENTDDPQQLGRFEVLQTPQRIEIEREDALNLLACLCERGVSLYSKEVEKDESKQIDSVGKDTTNNDAFDVNNEAAAEDDGSSARKSSSPWGENSPHEGKAKSPSIGSKRLPSELEPETIDAVVESLRKISKSGRTESSGEALPSEPNHELRMHVLNELTRSHTYALEMKRASMSASAWLRSIGHSDKKHASDGIYEEVDGNQYREQGVGADTNVKTRAGQAAGEREGALQSQSSEHDDDTMDLFAVKAMLHQAQMEAREKSDLANRLNEELSKCRAEIGRLKSESFSKTNFASPNRSILDEEDDDESAVSSSNANTEKANEDYAEQANEGKKRTGLIKKDTEDEGRVVDESFVDLESSFLMNGEGAEVVRESDQPIARELAMFKSALSDANAVIKQLHTELKEAKSDDGTTGREPPVIEVSEKYFSRALVDDTHCSPDKGSGNNTEQDPDRRTINVRMLDGENFVTDWSLTPSLPPPPDHGLRSPIVNALLEQWSPDRVLHNSLLSWMEKVMSGEDPSTVPPLTLSSLDHQVRDGFTMHVLPLLLRRPDILVDVKTRAHRTTTYDVAVSVKALRHPINERRHIESAHAPGNNQPLEAKPESGSSANSVTHSAVTDHMWNGLAPDHYEVGSTAASYATGVSSNDGPQQQGIMSALGGALGGLLSRRKQNSSNYYDAELPANSSYEVGSAVGTPGQVPIMDTPPPPNGLSDPVDMEPYHRLVSAPPGRIGVSFVEFRGHAMVSDVAQDSPLLGWIFPSDILIAIDEVPVSGMRLRDIIKVLQGRNERQRAMRVISSHAMNDFTMNASLPI